MLTVAFYTTPAGGEPVREWLKALPDAERKLIGVDIRTVQRGWPVGMPTVRKFAGGLWELRTDLPDGIARIFFTVYGSQMVLLHGFLKKTQKTPRQELEVARKRLNVMKRQEQ
jgi:phage-related protein